MPYTVAMTMTGTYDVRLVALSVVIAVVASYTALDCAGRVRATPGSGRAAWLAGGAVAMGIGIWSMHFIGMLAFVLPMPVFYDVPLALLSLLVAVVASGVAFFAVSRRTTSRLVWLAGGVCMGAGIVAMHYIGMVAMRMNGTVTYRPIPLILSVLIAVGASLAALWLFFRLRAQKAARIPWMVGGASVMGAAIAGMHYVGMAAAVFTMRAATPLRSSDAVQPSWLGVAAITVATFVVLGGTLLTALVDRRMTALRRNEERLRALGAQLARQLDVTRALTNSLGEGVYALDLRGLVTFINPAAERMLGWTEDEMLGRDLHALIHTSRVGDLRGHPTECPLDGAIRVDTAVRHDDDVFTRKDGSALPVAYSRSPILSNGEVMGSVVAFRDISAQKRLDEERAHLLSRAQEARGMAEIAQRRMTLLSQASRLLASSLDYPTTLANVARLAVPDVADWCTVDLAEGDGTLRRLAAAHADPAKDQLLQRLHQQYPPDPGRAHPNVEVLRTGQPKVVTNVPSALLDGVTYNAEHRYLHEELGCVSYISVPLVARGRVLGVLSFMSSRPSRRYGSADLPLAEELARRAALAVDNARLHKEVEDALRVRDDFLTAASHDLRTPLTSVIGRAGLLRMRLDSGKEITPDYLGAQVDALHHGAQRMLAVVDEITDVARLQMGHQLALDVETIAVDELVRDVVSVISDAKGYNGAPLVVDAPAGLTIAGDRVRLERVLQNVIGNAAKYSPAATPIDVEVGADGDDVTITVRDRGVGIPAAELPHIFTRFYRASTAKGIAGTGIGLAGSKSIVEQHGGRIAIESAVGEGTTVTMTLPRAVPAGSAAGPAARCRGGCTPGL